MYRKIKVYPDAAEPAQAAFRLHIQAELTGRLDDFELFLDGFIAAADSVAELRRRALARAREILQIIAAKEHLAP